MKKILAAILVMVYFTVSTGFVLCVHYCMDRYQSIQLGLGANDKCTKCGMHKSDNGCCRDEIKVVKLSVVHTAPATLNADFALPAVAEIHTDFLVTPFYNFIQEDRPVSHGPPLLHDQQIYLQNCVFRL